MYTLIAGLLVFFGIHLLPTVPAWRARLIARLGANGYRGLFALTALVGLVLIIYGMMTREYIVLYQPPMWTRHLALIGVLPAFILLAAAYMPSNIKRFTRHPMLWGVSLWAFFHLLANGDLGSVLLFTSFILYSLFDMWSANRRGEQLNQERRPISRDIAVVVVGVGVYVLFLVLHPYIIGVPVV